MATNTALAHTAEIPQDEKLWSGGKPPFKTSYGKLMMWYFLLSDAFTFAGLLISYGALRFSSATWPMPDFVFAKAPFLGDKELPLVFVTFMTFVLIASSVTMVRAVQEGHRENKKGVIFWMFLTILGGATFLSCQAWEWNNLIVDESMTITTDPFGTHTEAGLYIQDEHGHSYENKEDYVPFVAGDGYLIHQDHESGEWLKREYITPSDSTPKELEFGPKAFGALFFFITGFHGFHVFSGVLFLLIILINVASGLYASRKNGYEMVEKIGLYWHFVDLVWVFVFLVFYLL